MPAGHVVASCPPSLLLAAVLCRAATVLEQHGFASAKDWLAPWEAAWQKNLDSCSADGDCLIQLT